MNKKIAAIQKIAFFGALVGFGFLLGVISGVIAAETNEPQPATRFQPIAQSIENRIAVTLGGLGLIGAELWWFVLNKPKSHKANTQEGVQEVTVTVDGGYEPSQIVVHAGQPVRLNFYRKDPSSCLEEVRLPDFHIAQQLGLNQTTPIEFTPNKPGKYEFACGMNMFRGSIEVQETEVTDKITPLASHE